MSTPERAPGAGRRAPDDEDGGAAEQELPAQDRAPEPAAPTEPAEDLGATAAGAPHDAGREAGSAADGQEEARG